MERISTFLESSTIHGLNYISTTRKYSRVFWIFVVLVGFTSAGFLIHTSFQSWSVSPIKTAVETLPIADLKFPKVTVCPPKNTFTDLNHDLMLAETFNLTDDMGVELMVYTNKVIEEHIYRDDLDILQEKDRYYNWYYGYSKIRRTKNDDDGLNYLIDTSATSGVVTTQYFREQYQPSRVRRKVYYQVGVYPPESVRNNTNVTLHFNLEKVSMTGLADGLRVDGVQNLESELTSYSRAFSPPADDDDYRMVDLTRNIVIEEDLANIGMEQMPGFRLTWYYTGLEDNVRADSKYSDVQENQLFIW